MAFLQGVIRITSEGLQQHRSLRLVRDEVQAELLAIFTNRSKVCWRWRPTTPP